MNGVPWFGFRKANLHLAAIYRPAGQASWFLASLGTPPGYSQIRGSVAVWPSQVDSTKVEVAVIAGSSLWTGRVTPASGATISWSALPAMPGGATPAINNTALAATKYTYYLFGWQTRTRLFVLSGNREGFRLESNAAGHLSSGTWLSNTIGTAAKPPDQRWLSNGVAFAGGALLGQDAQLYGAGGEQFFLSAATTLQQLTEGGFRDHVRYQGFSTGVVLGAGSNPANEGTVAVEPIVSFGTAIRRSLPPPWAVVLADSNDGGDTWSGDQVVQVVNGWSGSNPASMTDPLTALELDGTRHFATMEISLTPTGATTCSPAEQSLWRLIYRRGTSAASIASATSIDNVNTFQVFSGNHDHPGLALTEDSGNTTAHVAFWNRVSNTITHWYHNDTLGTGSTNLSPSLLGAPAGAFSDAGDQTYVWSGLSVLRLCRLSGPTGTCATWGAIAPTPSAMAPDITFPPAGPSDPTATCTGGQRCFDTLQPFTFGAHPTIAGRLYAAYQGNDAGLSSVYFMWHQEGTSLDAWSTPVRIHPRGGFDAREYVDPEISVSRDGTITVTYSAADNPENDTIEQYVAWSTDGGSTWSQALLPVTWSPADLPFHCSRGKYFMGEYHMADHVGHRSYHLLHRSVVKTVLAGLWSTRWSASQF